MIAGTKVLVPMRVTPLAYSYGVVERPFDADRFIVAMPHGKRRLFQVFSPDDMIVCK